MSPGKLYQFLRGPVKICFFFFLFFRIWFLLLLLLPISSHFEAKVQKFIKLCKNSLRRKMTEYGQTDHGHVCSVPSELYPFFLCSSFSGGWGTASRSTFSSLYTQSTCCCRWCVGILAQAGTDRSWALSQKTENSIQLRLHTGHWVENHTELLITLSMG